MYSFRKETAAGVLLKQESLYTASKKLENKLDLGFERVQINQEDTNTKEELTLEQQR